MGFPVKQATSGLALGIFCLSFSLALSGQNPAVTINVDVQANRHSISPLIYGVNLFEDANTTTILQDLNTPLNRYGGNRASTYNWNLNSDNRGNDFFFESISDDVQTAGARGDTFITLTKNASAEPMVTIPMLGWIAKAGTAQPLPCSYPRAKFPNQDLFGDQFDPDCGNGLFNGAQIAGADPNDAFVANSLATQQSWVQHILGGFGAAANGGLLYYILDNEHDLWWETHHDVVPNAPHYNEERDLMFQYAAMIKAQDPNALVVGPEISGWIGYILSPADFQYAQANGYDFSKLPDRQAMSGSDYVPWLLGQFQQYANDHNGQRLLDFFTVHYYPQGGDNNSNTRSLWDPNFVDPSYINDTIMLIPRMKQWVADNYPGTKIGITEYNWGYINDEASHDNIGYAVTQADVLGIFGREGLDLATRFNAPPSGLPTYNSMKMYRNYDGSKSVFGDVSTSATVPNPDTVAAFSAQRTSDGNITVMLLSKYAAGDTPAAVSLANCTCSGPAQVWRLSGNGTAIQHLADIAVNNLAVSLTLPPQSITLLVINNSQPQPAPAVSLNPAAVNFGSQLDRSYSAASTVTLSNTGNAALNISSIAISGSGLSQINNCPAALAAGTNCQILVAPTAVGALNGTLTITDNAAGSPHQVAVSGMGTDVMLVLARPARPSHSTANTVTGQLARLAAPVAPAPTPVAGSRSHVGSLLHRFSNLAP